MFARPKQNSSNNIRPLIRDEVCESQGQAVVTFYVTIRLKLLTGLWKRVVHNWPRIHVLAIHCSSLSVSLPSANPAFWREERGGGEQHDENQIEMEVEGFLPEELICANVSHLHNLVPGQELGFPKDTVDTGLPSCTVCHPWALERRRHQPSQLGQYTRMTPRLIASGSILY